MERNTDNLSSMSREDLELYTLTLELKIHKQVIFLCNKDYKINKYKKRAHTYKVEMERCRRKLTRMYQMLYDMYYCDYGDKEDAKQLVKEWKNV